MAGWAVSEQAIQSLLNMGTQLEALAERIHKETEKLKTTFEENEDGLGAHSSSIASLIEEVEGAEADATIPVKKLVLKLQRAAVIRQQHLDNNRYNTKGRSR